MSTRLAVSLILPVVLPLTQVGVVSAQEDTGPWKFRVGTGLQGHYIQGDLGFTSFRGAEKADVDLSAADVEEFAESALELQALATKGRWTFHLSFNHLKLEDESSIDVAGGALSPLKSKFNLDYDYAEVLAAYRFAETRGHLWGVLAGVQYTQQEYNIRISGGNTQRKRSLNQNWLTYLVGLTHEYPLTATLVWENRLAVGFGEPDSYWDFETQLAWQFARSWNAGLYFIYRTVDFENDNPGDSDYYLYDVKEFGPRLGIAYTF